MDMKNDGFGRFCNYSVYWVEGKDSETGRKKIKKVDAVSEDSAIRKAGAAGVVGPYSVKRESLEPPTDRQLSYAAKLGLDIPDGCTKDDVGSILSRHNDYDGEPDPDPGLVDFMEASGLCFSRFDCEAQLLQRAIFQFEAREKALLYAYAVSLSRSGASRFLDPRKDAAFPAFERFADQVAGDLSLVKSLEDRSLYDYQHPSARSKIYKAAAGCL